ncbi:MAG: hypothetical protein HY074_04885 [Deltaproteobacteria bacterium]|nr:hypothetical protein [Deltaproteobacteria bacterium]
MSLSDWAKNDWLKTHKTSRQEIEGLFSIVERELKDAQVEGISSDGKFTHAYRASLTLGTVLLYVSGYAPARGQSHHYRTIAAIPKILGKEANDDAHYLEQCRVKRNAAEYDSANEASETEAVELVEFAKEFRKTVEAWLKKSGSHEIRK